MTTEVEEAMARLKRAVPMLVGAFTEIMEECEGTDDKPAILFAQKCPDGSGQMKIELTDPMALIKDLALLTGTSIEMSEEDWIQYKAAAFASRLRKAGVEWEVKQ